MRQSRHANIIPEKNEEYTNKNLTYPGIYTYWQVKHWQETSSLMFYDLVLHPEIKTKSDCNTLLIQKNIHVFI